MASTPTPPKPVAAHLSPVWRVQLVTPQPQSASPAARAADAQQAEQAAQTQHQLIPDELLVEIDRASGRFVHTLLDASTHEVLMRYPSEEQLAFSRAISAYVRAAND